MFFLRIVFPTDLPDPTTSNPPPPPMDRRVSFHHKSLTSKILDGKSDDSDENIADLPAGAPKRPPKPKPPLLRQQSRSSMRKASVIGNRKGSAAIRRVSTYTIASRGNWGSKWEFLLSCVGRDTVD